MGAMRAGPIAFVNLIFAIAAATPSMAAPPAAPAHGGNPDAPKASAMLEDNLRKVPAHVLSPAGRARLPERQAELEKFLQDLRRETDNLRTL
jgi:hypothetical protein